MITTDLAGRVAVITGAGAGIGREIAVCLAAAGAIVAAADIDGARAAATVECLRASGATAMAVVADVRDAAQVEEMVRAVVSSYGGLHIAVNNVGMMGGRRAGPFVDTPTDDLVAVVERNLLATMLCCRAEAPAIAASGGGVILNVSSGEASRPSPLLAAYGAAKAAIDHLTRTLAVELGPQGIRVNAMAPGTTYTDEVAAAISPAAFAARGASNPLGRPCRADELGHLAVFLASDAAGAITGQVIHADNGAGLGSAPTGARPDRASA